MTTPASAPMWRSAAPARIDAGSGCGVSAPVMAPVSCAAFESTVAARSPGGRSSEPPRGLVRGQERLDGGAEFGLAGAGCVEKRGALRGGFGQGVLQERFFVHRDLLVVEISSQRHSPNTRKSGQARLLQTLRRLTSRRQAMVALPKKAESEPPDERSARSTSGRHDLDPPRQLSSRDGHGRLGGPFRRKSRALGADLDLNPGERGPAVAETEVAPSPSVNETVDMPSPAWAKRSTRPPRSTRR